MKVIFWDFDGVILNSNEVRDMGFSETLKDYPADQVNKLLEFHRINGGLSRYVKFRYFFEEIRNEKLSDARLNELTNSFSTIMKKALSDKGLLIMETVYFIKELFEKGWPMHIVSGSDGTELLYLCKKLEIDQYFLSIQGSPTPKKELVSNVLLKKSYDKSKCLLIGDSVNDLEAAKTNDIAFYGYNNPNLRECNYIDSFKDFKL